MRHVFGCSTTSITVFLLAHSQKYVSYDYKTFKLQINNARAFVCCVLDDFTTKFRSAQAFCFGIVILHYLVFLQ